MASALKTTNSYVNLELSIIMLRYPFHKMDLNNQELLVKVASEFYTDLDVETAKEMLFRTVSTGV